MFVVYHYTLCPFSRKLRILLREKNIEFELLLEKYWERRREFLALNPAGTTPAIKVDSDEIITGNYAICEYLEEAFPAKKFSSRNIVSKAHMRSITEWFDNKFFNEVARHLITEKIIKPITGKGAPNSGVIRAAKHNLLHHIDYIGYLLQDSRYLCDDEITLADFAAAAQLSVLDFTGDVPWERNDKVKEWYALIKSRPSFRSLLMDVVPGLSPPQHYHNPDF